MVLIVVVEVVVVVVVAAAAASSLILTILITYWGKYIPLQLDLLRVTVTTVIPFLAMLP